MMVNCLSKCVNFYFLLLRFYFACMTTNWYLDYTRHSLFLVYEIRICDWLMSLARNVVIG